MKRTKTPSFVLELPLVITPGDERMLVARFETARRLYNAVLGEGLRRQKLMRESRKWRDALSVADKEERSLALRSLCLEYGFTGASLSSFGTKCKNTASWKELLGAHETQRVSERAFGALEQYGFGKRGKPRFKGKHRPLHSIEGKSNSTGIRWKSDTQIIEWNGLYMAVKVVPAGKDLWQESALKRTTKYSRIVWRNLNGIRRWYVQLTQTGHSPHKAGNHTVPGMVVGLDMGPSTVAVVATEDAALVQFCRTVDQPWKEMRCLQRRLDRSRRATNSDCFNPDGTWKKGKRQQVFSSRYRATREELSEVERKLASERKRSHGELANDVISHGNIIQTERLSYRAFQKMYGRSVKRRAPSMFINLLKRKAERAGGELRDLPTEKLKMSQYDHPTETYTKKPLSRRWHVLGDGSGIVQRDIYSAFLARCVASNQHHPIIIATMWSAQEPVLRRTGWLRNQPASGNASAEPTVIPSEQVVRQRRLAIDHNSDAVAVMREPGRSDGFAFRTPCL